jgi:UDP-GlcNAc:undecaprenyl-phosphate GlcNAc-1-phosphate transferase
LTDPYRIAVAFFLTVLMTVILEHLAPRFGMVDHPGGRKQHTREVPLVGGVAIFIGFIASMLGDESFHPAIWLLAAMALMVIIGIIDDIREISARYKLLGQLVVATVLVLTSGTAINSFGNLVGTGDLRPGALGALLTIFCLVGLVNALNMIDGLDGLAGGLGLVSAITLAIAAKIAGQPQSALILAAFAAGIAGFLVFNLRFPWQSHARVFLGDAGSNLIGLVLAYFAVLITQSSDGRLDTLPPMCAVWLIGLPILDTLAVMTRRIADRRSPFSAGRDHLHHILLGLGFSHTSTLWTMLAAASILAACGMIGWRLHAPDWLMLWSAVAILIVYYMWTRRVIRALNKGAH